MAPVAPTYLDHAATTPVRPAVLEAMLPWLGDRYGNPSGAHRAARAARRALDDARDVLGAALGVDPGEVVFTSGGTESDNLAVFGVVEAHGGVPVCSAIEHHAVLEPVEHLGGRTVGVTADGRVDLDALGSTLEEVAAAGQRVSLVSVMAANNETGVVQNVSEVVAVVRAAAPGALVHCDAVQAFAWLDVADLAADVDLVSVTGHKFGGPQGAGVLASRHGATYAARQIGGGQERERRSGTQNVAGIVGLAAAVEAVVADRAATAARVRARRDRLLDGLVAAVPGVIETGGPDGRSRRLPGHAHVCIDGVVSESLLVLLEQDEIYASAAASCASGAQEPSHVLAAMGVPRERAQGALRLSLGSTTTDADVDRALATLPRAIDALRGQP